MNSLACSDVVPLLNPLIEGLLSHREAGYVKSHFRECSDCSAAFFRRTTAAMLREQASIGEGPPGTRWAQLRLFAERGAAWARDEIETLREVMQTAYRGWPLYDGRPASKTRLRGFAAGTDTAGGWPSFVDVPLICAGEQEHRRIRVQIVTAPTVTRAGMFKTSACPAELNVKAARLFCTIHPDRQTAIVFEQSFQCSDTQTLVVRIRAPGFPSPERDVVLPQECVCFSVQGRHKGGVSSD